MQKKKIFTWLALVASVVCLAAFAWAGNTPTAEKTTQVDTYDKLKTAVNNAVPGDVIEITKSIAMGPRSLDIPQNKTVTLSLNKGVTLLASCDVVHSALPDVYVIKNMGNLTIKGSGTIKAVGTAQTTAPIVSAIYNGGSGYVKVSENVEIIAKALANGNDSDYYCEACAIGGFKRGESANFGNITVTDNVKLNAESTFENGAARAFGIRAELSPLGAGSASVGDITVTDNVKINTKSKGSENRQGYDNLSHGIESMVVGGTSGLVTVTDNVEINTDLTGKGWTIPVCNYAGSGNMAVTGNVKLNANAQSDKGMAGAVGVNICDNNKGIVAICGNVTATATAKNSANAYALVMAPSEIVNSRGTADTDMMIVTSGNFTGNIMVSPDSTVKAMSLRGGTFTNCNKSDLEKFKGNGCTVKDAGTNTWTIENAVAVSMDKEAVFVPKGKSDTVNVQLITNDGKAQLRNVTSLNIIGIPTLPAGLTVEAQGTKAVKVKNTGCATEGVYDITVLLFNADGDAAAAVLEIATKPEPKPGEEVPADKPEDLRVLFKFKGVAEIKLSEGYSGYLTEKLIALGEKILNLNGQGLLLEYDGIIEISKGGSFTIDGTKDNSIVSKDNGPIFEVHGSLMLNGGKYYAKNSKYFSRKGAKVANVSLLNAAGSEDEEEEISITEGTKFWFGEDEEGKEAKEAFITDYLAADGLTLTETEESGLYEVTKTGSSSSSGCNAGFAALAMLGLAFVPTRRKK